MSAKYLGETFDIHGGGMDLLFPHHECEIAQSTAAHNHAPARYWMHHNMITINGQKMAKSLNNGIKVVALFEGNHELLSRGFGPDVLRFFVLQAHYRSTLDFSEDALEAAEKGLKRLLEAWKKLESISTSENSSFSLLSVSAAIKEALLDDLNTPIAKAQFFELARCINMVYDNKGSFTKEDILEARSIIDNYFYGILGIPSLDVMDSNVSNDLMEILIEMRNEAKQEKNYALSDAIRNKLKDKGIELMDSKDKTTWKFS
jgi:cysteinyl-tRNA synthetase